MAGNTNLTISIAGFASPVAAVDAAAPRAFRVFVFVLAFASTFASTPRAGASYFVGVIALVFFAFTATGATSFTSTTIFVSFFIVFFADGST